MKPPAFRYHRPASLDEALELLAALPNARLLAGGQSLMPMLNLRVVLPDDLIDINRLTGLAGIVEQGDRIVIGALTRQRALERSGLVRQRLPLLAEAVGQIGHVVTRNRGTIGGSLCHLDPAAELPVVAAAYDATVQMRSRRGLRSVAMAAFPAGIMTPAIEADEIVTAIEFAPWEPGHGVAFVEFARRPGDFAVVAVAVLLALTSDGRIARVAIALGGMGDGPVRASVAERLVGSGLDEDRIARAADHCAAIDVPEDARVPAWYRKRLAAVLTRRALTIAWQRALSDVPR